MDPISAIKAATNIALAIIKWIDQTTEKQEIMFRLAVIVARITTILDELSTHVQSGKLDARLTPEIEYLGSILNKTHEHLRAWQPQKFGLKKVITTVNPQRVIESLQKDEQQISQHIIMFMFTLLVRAYAQMSLNKIESDSRSILTGWIQNPEVAEFWRKHVGTEAFFIENERFKIALKEWFIKPLDDVVCDNLVYFLDEYRIGTVHVKALDNFAGSKSLQLEVAAYVSNLDKAFITPTDSESKVSMPLLVWIDDNPSHNTGYVQLANKLGIHVELLLSTGEAKIWIDTHLDILRKGEGMKSVRFITDNARFEEVAGEHLFNLGAGEEILRYIRGRRLNQIPVLVFTFTSIGRTQYVKEFQLAGSTIYDKIIVNYIKGFAEGRDDSQEWAKFRAA